MKAALARLVPLCCSLLLAPASAVDTSPADLRAARAWTARHLDCTSSTVLPFSFVLGGEPSATLLPRWALQSATEGNTTRCVFTEPDGSGLTVSMNATVHENSVEWVVIVRNDGHGTADSAVLSDVLGADLRFPAGTGAFEVHHALAYGEGVPTDYMPQNTRLGCQPGCTCAAAGGRQDATHATCGCVNPGNPPGPHLQQQAPTFNHLTLGTNGGRSSSGSIICPPYDGPLGAENNGSLPFFRLGTPGLGGVVGAIGWSGQWQANFSCDDSPKCTPAHQHANCPGSAALRFTAGQQHLETFLRPGEEIRTPKMVLMFYAEAHPLDHTLDARAHNLWRRLVREQYSPRGPFPVAASAGNLGTMPAAQQLQGINQIHKHYLPLNSWWIDAGWWQGVGEPNWWWPAAGSDNCSLGDWVPSTKLYPHGIQEVTTAAHRAQLRVMLWFEVERACNGSKLAREHPLWVLQDPGFCVQGFGLLNLGDPQARAWITERVSTLIRASGVDHFRQDMNFDPLSFWLRHDELGRTGMTENAYISGKYAFLDSLLKTFPDLTVGGCAGGGREIDIEAMSRAQINSRADGFCANDAGCSQGLTHSLSLWAPNHGQSSATSSLITPQGNIDTEYAFHSFMSTSMAFIYPWADNSTPPTSRWWGRLRGWLQQYEAVRPLYDGDFYQLTPFSLSTFDWIAWQLQRPDLGHGMLQIFRRSNSSLGSVSFPVYGLELTALYNVTDWAGGRTLHPPGRKTTEPEQQHGATMLQRSGQSLRTEGLVIHLPPPPAACMAANASAARWTASACGSSTVVEVRRVKSDDVAEAATKGRSGGDDDAAPATSTLETVRSPPRTKCSAVDMAQGICVPEQAWCPCKGTYPDGRSLCESLRPQPAPRKEVIAYPGVYGLYGQFGSDWRQWDWTKITTVALYVNLGSTEQGCQTNEQGHCDSPGPCCVDAELMCTAHAHGARVITWFSSIGACPSDILNQSGTCSALRNPIVEWPTQLRVAPTDPHTTNPARVQEWANLSARFIVDNGFDGVLLDIEGVADHGQEFRDAITSGFCTMREQLTAVLPGSLLTFTAAATPYFTGFHGLTPEPYGALDLQAIDKCIDFWQPGMYCTCSGEPFSNETMDYPPGVVSRGQNPMQGLENMLSVWGAQGIPPSRLSILFPWFNCDFLCEDELCTRTVNGPMLNLDPREVFLRANPCGLPAAAFDPSLAPSMVGPDAGPGYNQVLELLERKISNISHNLHTQTKSFRWKDNNSRVHEVTYDDAETLAAKYKWAEEHGFRGVGFWQSGTTLTGANKEEVGIDRPVKRPRPAHHRCVVSELRKYV